MDETMWSTNWTRFTEDLQGLPSTIESGQIAKAATNRQVARLEKSINHALPPVFRRFLLNCSAGIDLSWSFEGGALVRLKDERESIPSGEMSFHLDDFLTHNPQ